MQTLHPTARAWLDRVDHLAGDLGPVARRELVADLRDHLDRALPPDATDGDVATVLARLGDPADVVDEALHVGATTGPLPSAPRPTPTSAPPPPAPTTGPPPPTAVPNGWEVTSLTLLVLSGFMLFFFAVQGVEVFWLMFGLPVAVVGVVVLTTATRWTVGERLAAIAIPLSFVAALAAVILLPPGSGAAPEVTCSEFEADGRHVRDCTDDVGNPVDREGHPLGPEQSPPWEGWIVPVSLVTPPVMSTLVVVGLVRRLKRRVSGTALPNSVG